MFPILNKEDKGITHNDKEIYTPKTAWIQKEDKYFYQYSIINRLDEDGNDEFFLKEVRLIDAEKPYCHRSENYLSLYRDNVIKFEPYLNLLYHNYLYNKVEHFSVYHFDSRVEEALDKALQFIHKRRIKVEEITIAVRDVSPRCNICHQYEIKYHVDSRESLGFHLEKKHFNSENKCIFTQRIFISEDSAKKHLSILNRLEVEYDKNYDKLTSRQRDERHFLKSVIPDNGYDTSERGSLIHSDSVPVVNDVFIYRILSELENGERVYRLIEESVYNNNLDRCHFNTIDLNLESIKEYKDILKNLLGKYVNRNNLTKIDRSICHKLLVCCGYLSEYQPFIKKESNKLTIEVPEGTNVEIEYTKK